MSQSYKDRVSRSEIVECHIRRSRGEFAFDGKKLSPPNAAYMTDLYVVMACLWQDVSLHPELLTSRWVRALSATDVREVINGFKAVDARLMSGIDDPASFYRWRRDQLPWMGQILGPLRENIERGITAQEGLRQLRTCLLFICRGNFPEPLGLEERAFDDWSQRNLGDVVQSPSEAEIECFTRVFPRRPLDPQLFRPRYGSGHNSDVAGTDLECKYRAMGFDPLLEYFAQKVGWRPEDFPVKPGNLDRCGTLKFVPKQLDKLRVITMEPSSLMFFQQGVASMIYALISRSHWRHHIDVRLAELNCDLAWEGSLTGEYATADLSNASDGVKYHLVKSLSQRSCLREALAATRSREVLYDGQRLVTNYFAPMGSACCFPVECAVFGAIVDSIMRRHRDRRAWRVYGDDIILPSDYYNELVERLGDLGFVVNEDKSFTGSHPFRESCGGDYFRGIHVTPVRVSRRWRGLRPAASRPSTIEGNIDLANRLVEFPLARQRVIHALAGIVPRVIFDDTGEVGLFSTSPTNWRSPARWNTDYQSMEYRVGEVASRQTKGDDAIRLWEWFRSKEIDQAPVSEEELSIGPSRRARWQASWRSPAPGWPKGLDESPKERRP